MAQNSPLRLIDIHEVVRLTSLSRTTIWRRMKQDRFPKSLRLSEQCVRWKASEVEDWIASLPTSCAHAATQQAH